ncbi:MAG: proline--tRNA ligase [candidate division Zixibacteria bacterium]|nr:proline--tRNA ligase [candidate division Zixibacteria bacterium]
MRWSEAFIPTLREVPAEAELISHQLLLRAGMIRKLAAGIYIYLPLFQRTLLKVAQIVREEMNRQGAVEITMPVLHPAEIWQETGRWDTVGKELIRLKDRHGRDLVLGPTHEEIITFLVRGELRSYRQLPINLYQIQVKFRDEIRPRFGLLRGREFTMKDAYTFDATEESFKKSYQKMIDAYFAAFNRCGLETVKVESDTGAMGGKSAHEFIVLVDTEGGESLIFTCSNCDYAVHSDRASFKEAAPPSEKVLPYEKVHTPNVMAAEEVARFLKLPVQKLVKTMIYKTDNGFVAALVRGDREVNLVKLKNLVGSIEMDMAGTEDVQRITQAPKGFAGPVGLAGLEIIADTEVAVLPNFVSGANEGDYHIKNINTGRDFKPSRVADIKVAVEGEVCASCGKGKLKASRGIEVGNTFSLGTKYSVSLKATFLDEKGGERPFIMGSYGIGITRTAQAAVEKFHDADGIIWPKTIAPLDVHIVPVKMEDAQQAEVAERLYRAFNEAGIEPLLDDRKERAGVKFKDADLIGIPVQIVIGDRGLKEGKLEFKVRKTKESSTAPIGEAVPYFKKLWETI